VLGATIVNVSKWVPELELSGVLTHVSVGSVGLVGAVSLIFHAEMSQSFTPPDPVVVTLITTEIVAPADTVIVPVEPFSVVAALMLAAAATYGPTKGPRPGVPTGLTPSLSVS
jgi:hypothetical protein